MFSPATKSPSPGGSCTVDPRQVFLLPRPTHSHIRTAQCRKGMKNRASLKMNLQRKAGRHCDYSHEDGHLGLLLLSQRKIIKKQEKKISLGNVSRKDTHVQPTQSGKEMKPPGVEEAVASHVCGYLCTCTNLNKIAFPVPYDITESHSICRRAG